MIVSMMVSEMEISGSVTVSMDHSLANFVNQKKKGEEVNVSKMKIKFINSTFSKILHISLSSF